MIGFIILLIPFVLIAAVLAMVIALMKDDKEDFEKKVRAIYLYVVEFAMLILIIMGTIGLVVSATDIMLPTKNTYHTSVMEENAKNRNVKSAITSLAVIGIGLPTFLIHKKKIEELKEA